MQKRRGNGLCVFKGCWRGLGEENLLLFQHLKRILNFDCYCFDCGCCHRWWQCYRCCCCCCSRYQKAHDVDNCTGTDVAGADFATATVAVTGTEADSDADTDGDI